MWIFFALPLAALYLLLTPARCLDDAGSLVDRTLETLREVYVGYDSGPLCRSFLIARHSGEIQARADLQGAVDGIDIDAVDKEFERSTRDLPLSASSTSIARSPDTSDDNANTSFLLTGATEEPWRELKRVRDLMIPILASGNSPVGSRVIEDMMSSSSVSYLFYDFTRINFSPQSSILSSDPSDVKAEDMMGDFQWLKFIEVDRVRLPKAINATKFRDAVSSLPCIAFAEIPPPRRLNTAAPFPSPPPEEGEASRAAFSLNRSVEINDPYYQQQWYLHKMNVPPLWTKWRGPLLSSSAVSTIGIADTGCNVHHRDLEGRFWKNPFEICDNGIDDDDNGYIDDCYGWNFFGRSSDLTEKLPHGTSVSGAVTANTNNNYGVAGICQTCKLMCLKIGDYGLGLGPFAEALNYAKGWGVKMINFSAGGPASRLEMHSLIAAADSDMLIVAAAGNAGCEMDGRASCTFSSYPPKYNLPNVLVVGASNQFGRRASFSNVGPRSTHVFAPGQSILLPTARRPPPRQFTAAAEEKDTGDSNAIPQAVVLTSDFAAVSGTSFSSPLTAGVVGLIRSRYPRLSYQQVVEAITRTCARDPSFNGLARCPGVVDAKAAMEYAESLAPSSETPDGGGAATASPPRPSRMQRRVPKP